MYLYAILAAAALMAAVSLRAAVLARRETADLKKKLLLLEERTSRLEVAAVSSVMEDDAALRAIAAEKVLSTAERLVSKCDFIGEHALREAKSLYGIKG